MNSQTLGEMFDCGKTQIGKMLKQKVSLLSLYESNALGSRVHTNKPSRVSEYEEINTSLYEWCYAAITWSRQRRTEAER